MSGDDTTKRFWNDAFSIKGSVTVRVTRRALAFAGLAFLVYELNELIVHIDFGVGVAPYEVAGAALGLLLVLRTNAGYDRWWEARKLWGGITNESRNLTIAALAYGPSDPDWRDRIVRWTAALAHTARHSLRGERTLPKVAALLGPAGEAEVASAEHMPGLVALRIAEILREGGDDPAVNRFAFLKAEEARGLLIDYIGGCERIRKSPLPRAYAIDIRRFIVLFLVTLPFALLVKVGNLTALATLLIAYPILSLDEIGAELQNPFDSSHVGHLPLDEICDTIESNVLALRGIDSGRTTP